MQRKDWNRPETDARRNDAEPPNDFVAQRKTNLR